MTVDEEDLRYSGFHAVHGAPKLGVLSNIVKSANDLGRCSNLFGHLAYFYYYPFPLFFDDSSVISQGTNAEASVLRSSAL